MTRTIDINSWVFVVVQNPGRDETIVGQTDSEHDISFIPVFHDRDTALQGMAQIIRQPGQTVEIQAILCEDLLRYARQNGFLLFFLDGSGRVDKFGPDGRPL